MEVSGANSAKPKLESIATTMTMAINTTRIFRFFRSNGPDTSFFSPPDGAFRTPKRQLIGAGQTCGPRIPALRKAACLGAPPGRGSGGYARNSSGGSSRRPNLHSIASAMRRQAKPSP